MKNLTSLLLLVAMPLFYACSHRLHPVPLTCMEHLKNDIKSNWKILSEEDFPFSAVYQRNDSFCLRVCNHYKGCLVGKISVQDLRQLFGKESIYLTGLIEYNSKNSLTNDVMRLDFGIRRDTVSHISYRKRMDGDL